MNKVWIRSMDPKYYPVGTYLINVYIVGVLLGMAWEKNLGRENVLSMPHFYVYVIGVTICGFW